MFLTRIDFAFANPVLICRLSYVCIITTRFLTERSYYSLMEQPLSILAPCDSVLNSSLLDCAWGGINIQSLSLSTTTVLYQERELEV